MGNIVNDRYCVETIMPWYDLFLVSCKSPNFNLISYTPHVVKNNFRKALRILYQKYMFLYNIRSGIARTRLSYIMFVPWRYWRHFGLSAADMLLTYLSNFSFFRGHEIIIKSQISWEWLQMSSQWLLSRAKLYYLIDAV